METTEKIVESYCRYVKNWFTIPNIKCKGQYEIDLLAVDTTQKGKKSRYHIECGVSISSAFSKLTAKKFSEEEFKVPVNKAKQRRTIGFFIERKFNVPQVKAELAKYGFEDGNYSYVIATWGWEKEAKEIADAEGIILWDFREIVSEIANAHLDNNAYFTDDTARTIQLFAKAQEQLKGK